MLPHSGNNAAIVQKTEVWMWNCTIYDSTDYIVYGKILIW